MGLCELRMQWRSLFLFLAEVTGQPEQADGNHMEATWKPHGDYLETKWKPRRNHLETTWKPCGNHVQTTWKPRTSHLETTWKPHGDHWETTWKPLGHHLETTSIPKETATTLWKRNFLKFWNRTAASTILAPLPPLFNNFVVVNGNDVAAVEQQRWTC